MQNEENIVLIIALGTLLFVMLAGFIIIIMILYKKTQLKNREEKIWLENKYQKEKLKAQLEIKEQTLLNIGQELHDNVGQILSLAKIQLNAIIHKTGDKEGKLENTKELVGKAINDIRMLSKSLNSEHISSLPIIESLGSLLKQIELSGSVQTKLKITGTERPMDPEKRVVIYRMCQEILNNVIKHANAKEIDVTIDYQLKYFYLSFIDDGIGYDVENISNQNGTGLKNLRFRANVLNSELSINSRTNNGTVITLKIPYSRNHLILNNEESQV